MAVEIYDVSINDDTPGAALFCNTTDRFFGPRFSSREAAEAYMVYLEAQGVRNGDPRLDEGFSHYLTWLPLYEAVEADWRGRESVCDHGHPRCAKSPGAGCYEVGKVRVGLLEELTPVCDQGHWLCSVEYGGPCEDG